MHIHRLLLMAGLHFVSMYVLMYAMVDRFANVYPNLNTLYMAGIMTSPMLLMEGLLMGSMYEHKKMLHAVMVAGGVLFVVCLLFLRLQTAVGDAEFLRSMIPHHAGALLMCNEAPIEDSEIQELCRSIILSQQSEIDQMKAILERLE